MEETTQTPPKTMRVPCRPCGGKGILVLRPNGPEIAAHQVCTACGGQKEVTVRDIDPCLSIDISDAANKKRTIMAVTWGGELMCGPPLSKAERVAAASHNDATGGLIAMLMIMAGEVSSLRSRLREVESKLNIHTEDA